MNLFNIDTRREKYTIIKPEYNQASLNLLDGEQKAVFEN